MGDRSGEAAVGVTGRCQCGAVRFRAGAPLAAYCCHCTECQAQSASAFGISVVVDAATLEIEGEAAAWVRDAGRPSEVACTFCPRCGTRLNHARAGAGRATLKGGALDARAAIEPDGHIWLGSALPFVRAALPAPADPGDHHEGQPADYPALIDRWAARGRARRLADAP